MSNARYNVPQAENEPVFSYAPGSPDRDALKRKYEELKHAEIEIPMHIGGEDVHTSKRVKMFAPHDLDTLLGKYHQGNSTHVKQAIDAALHAKPQWESMPWEERAAIFLRAAELLSGPYRARMNAATMLAQSKNAYQSEIDAVAEMADFFRFNVEYMTQVYAEQPQSAKGIWNRLQYRPLEGFVFAISPFNFTSIAANLAAAPAMMGNTVVWKCADSQIYSARVIMDLYREAGLPDGVINLVFADGPQTGKVIFKHPDFGGLHFTGSTGVFQNLWSTIGANISNYRSYPRIVGETGGKDFIVAHPSADPAALITAMTRGAFEFQGQKCSAASRAYVPKSIWKKIKRALVAEVDALQMGSPEDFTNFINAVIDERAYDKISGYVARAQKDKKAKIIAGGSYSKEEGYFIRPTIIETSDPAYRTMCEEIFGPVLTVYPYDDQKFSEVLEVVDKTSPYALTGAIFANDRNAVIEAMQKLRHAAGNFYINDKPTGAVVGQQPFGGSRGSGTNDKAGSILNLYRWVSPRTIKENFNPPTDYRYPFMGDA
ncbi:MAG: L-glutamate gamma-semialdehyde dehydrogenase [Saprospiraceae bacterium]|nr:L-glutamate gamma-semialdehyde dehydrogenase [Saprospiraceae bacterium]